VGAETGHLLAFSGDCRSQFHKRRRTAVGHKLPVEALRLSDGLVLEAGIGLH